MSLKTALNLPKRLRNNSVILRCNLLNLRCCFTTSYTRYLINVVDLCIPLSYTWPIWWVTFCNTLFIRQSNGTAYPLVCLENNTPPPPTPLSLSLLSLFSLSQVINETFLSCVIVTGLAISIVLWLCDWWLIRRLYIALLQVGNSDDHFLGLVFLVYWFVLHLLLSFRHGGQNITGMLSQCYSCCFYCFYT